MKELKEATDILTGEAMKEWKGETMASDLTNRIEAAIARIEEKLKTVPEDKRRSLEETLKTSWQDLVAYQKLQSTAFACGKLTMEEAQTLFRIYGGELPSPEKWNKMSLAAKIVGTSTAGELAKMRICDVL